MNPISVKDRLPENNTYVLIHAPNRPWIPSPNTTNPEGVFWIVAKFVRGISEEERNSLDVSDERRNRYCSADVHGNNLLPYCWNEFGPDSFFGQEVEHWCELPTLP